MDKVAQPNTNPTDVKTCDLLSDHRYPEVTLFYWIPYLFSNVEGLQGIITQTSDSKRCSSCVVAIYKLKVRKFLDFETMAR